MVDSHFVRMDFTNKIKERKEHLLLGRLAKPPPQKKEAC